MTPRWQPKGSAVAVIPIPTFLVTREGEQFTFVCPMCRRRHYHGAFEGHRVSHCRCWEPQGYNITLADNATAIEGDRA